MHIIQAKAAGSATSSKKPQTAPVSTMKVDTKVDLLSSEGTLHEVVGPLSVVTYDHS